MIEITRGLHDVERAVAIAELHVDYTAQQMFVAAGVGDLDFIQWAVRELRRWIYDTEEI